MMIQKNNSHKNGKLTSEQRSGVRIALATGATLMMLVGAQLFASGGTSSEAAVAATAVATSTTSNSITSISDNESDQLVSNTTQNSVTYAVVQAQPVPSTHSSR